MKKLVTLLLILLPTFAFANVSPLVDYVLVKKSERKLFLMRGGAPLKEYPISLGLRPVGHKQYEGDMRTPEGLYLLDWRNPNSNFYKSIHISYPSTEDLVKAGEAGKPAGGMVMIHGLPNQRDLEDKMFNGWDWTEGCIAVDNRAMDEIWGMVSDGTPILILP